MKSDKVYSIIGLHRFCQQRPLPGPHSLKNQITSLSPPKSKGARDAKRQEIQT